MRKLFTTLLLAAACTCAMAQTVKDSIWDDTDIKIANSNWEVGVTFGLTYNYNFNAPAGLSNSGFGLDLSLFEMQWHGWKGGFLTVGILDLMFDWQYLQKGNAFDGQGNIGGGFIKDAKGHRSNVIFGFPLAFNQQFSKDFGITVAAVPGFDFYSYRNEYLDMTNVQHKETLYPTKNRVGFHLDLKAILWYSDFGIMVRYQPIPSKDLGTTTLSVGIAIRN